MRRCSARALPGADDWTELKPEYSIPPALTGDASHKTRVDFMLTGGITHYLEVKNCHLVAEDGWGYFPDSVSDRAAKHVGCLAQLAERGYRATVLLCVQRSDCRFGVRPSDFTTPSFATAARAAAAAGVEFRAVRATTDVGGTTLTHELPVDLEPYDTAAVAAEWGAQRRHDGLGEDGERRAGRQRPVPAQQAEEDAEASAGGGGRLNGTDRSHHVFTERRGSISEAISDPPL